jgi:capsular polysaccharide biosynthesis protein
MFVNTELDLPVQSDTVLAFFERIQKQYPTMGCFSRRENNEYCLEEDHSSGQYRWVSLEVDRVGSGVVNPSDFAEVYAQDKFILELVPYMLGISHLDVDSLDVTFACDFYCVGGHDQVIAEALGSSAFNCLLDLPNAKAIDHSPSIVIALSADCRTQARISVESRTSIFDPDKMPQSLEEPISLSFTIRQYPSGTGKFDVLESFDRQCLLAEELMADRIVPNLVHPIINVIAQKRIT